MSRIVLFLICLAISLELSAQKDFHFENFTTAEGLSNNDVRSILRDQNGYLWVGTANGLNRFDGYRFRAYLPNQKEGNNIHNTVISTLVEDQRGYIWIAGNKGIEYYDPSRDSFHKLSIPEMDYPVNSNFVHGCKLLIDHKGRLWMVNESPCVLRWDPATATFCQLFPPDVPLPLRTKSGKNISDNILYGITKKSNTEAWLNTSYGIFSLNLEAETFHFHSMEGYRGDYPVSFLFQDDIRQRAWFLSFGDAYYSFDYKTGVATAWDIPLHQPLVTSMRIAAIGPDRLWFSAPGILDLKKNTFQPVHHIPDDRYSLPDAIITVAYRDPDRILWVGTNVGLAKLDPRLQAFRHVQISTHPKYRYDNSIVEMYQPTDSSRVYVTSFYNEHLYTYDFKTGKSGIILSTPERPLSATTRIFKDSYGITWLLAKSHIYQVSLDDEQFVSVPLPPLPEGISDRVINDIAEDTYGNLWFTKWRAGILYYDRQKKSLRYLNHEAPGLTTKVPYFVEASRYGQTIWVGTQGEGILEHHISGSRTTVHKHFRNGQHKFPVDNSNGLLVDVFGHLWVATDHGLARRDTNGTVKVFGIREGFVTDFFEGIEQDSKGRIWLATPHGISCIDPATFAIRNFDERHGIKIDGTLRHFSSGPRGQLYVGTTQGMIYFHPDSIAIDQRPPDLSITGFKVNGKDYKPNGLMPDYVDDIVLMPDEDFFTIEFTALNFTLPGDNTFFYKLEGLDKSWNKAGKNRIANYTKVPPGQYRFRLKVKNKDQIWNEEEKMINIIVRPPFWQMEWFMALTALAISGLAFAGYRFRVKQVRKTEQMKAAFDKKLAEVEMQALRSQMNPHFLFNCLNSINRFIQCNEPDAASAYLSKFSRLVRLVLDNSRTNLVTLRDELEALRLYLELESMRFVNRFSYKIEISHELDKTSIDVPPMLIQPYVENAIWHGLMHKQEDDGLLRLNIYPEGRCLIIEVIDNGIGREAAKELKSKSATLHKSHGMKVTAERIKVVNELYQTKASVSIIDLTDNQGQAMGTKVVLSLPL